MVWFQRPCFGLVVSREATLTSLAWNGRRDCGENFVMKLRTMLIAAILVATLALASNATGSTATFITLNSQPGDYIGGGITQTFTPGDGTFTVNTVYNDGVDVSFHTANYSSFWSLEFGPQNGQTLTQEEYEAAQRFAFHSPTRPGIDVNSDGRGLQGKDYLAAAGKVTFRPGATSGTIRIPMLGDRLARGNKSFHVLLSAPNGAPIADGSANVTIHDPNVPLTVLSMYGQPGDYISPGQLIITAADAAFTPSRNFYQAVSLSAQSLDSWNLDFAGPTSTTLTPGDYENAQRFPFQGAGTPGLSVSGAGQGGNTLTGRFVVLNPSYATNRGVQNFAADFEQH